MYTLSTDCTALIVKYNQFKELYISTWAGRDVFEDFFPIWSLPHHRARHELATDIYPGIQSKRSRALAKAIVCLVNRMNPIKMTVERSVYPLLWTLVIDVYYHVVIEVTVARDVNDSQGHVRWIKFRRGFRSEADAMDSAIAHMGENAGRILASDQFSHLEKIVLEYERVEYKPLPASWKSLKDKLHVWSTAKAKAYDQYVEKNGIPARASDQFPVSQKRRKDDFVPVVYTDEESAVFGEELKFEEENPEDAGQFVEVENADDYTAVPRTMIFQSERDYGQAWFASKSDPCIPWL